MSSKVEIPMCVWSHIAATYVASCWWEMEYKYTNTNPKKALYAKTRGIVVYDRTLVKQENQE